MRQHTNESLIQQLKLAEKDFILCRDGKGGIQIDTLEMASTKPTKDMSEGAGTIPVIFNIYRDKHKEKVLPSQRRAYSNLDRICYVREACTGVKSASDDENDECQVSRPVLKT